MKLIDGGTLWNSTTSEVVAQQVEFADNWRKRLVGLQFRRMLPVGSALLLDPCGSIHTCWMRFSIDVLFLDYAGRVVDFRDHLRPWRCCFPRKAARYVVELPAGLRPASLQIGDQLCMKLRID